MLTQDIDVDTITDHWRHIVVSNAVILSHILDLDVWQIQHGTPVLFI